MSELTGLTLKAALDGLAAKTFSSEEITRAHLAAIGPRSHAGCTRAAMTFLQRCLAFSLVVAVIACGGSDEDGGGSSPGVGAGGIDFQTKLSPFEGFTKSVGPLPPTGPAQLSLGVSARGDLTIEGSGDLDGGKLVGRAESGKIALAAEFKRDGTLKVDTGVPGAPKYDGDLPGLKDISIPIVGESAFDPFLLDGKNVDLAVKIPETTLPPIPLGSVPGKLQLTVSSKSEIHAAFGGSCVSVEAGAGSWNGELVPSGTLVLEGAIKLEVPGFDKTIELGEISIPVALGGKPVTLASTGSIAASDLTEGACGDSDNGSPPEPPAGDGGTTDASLPETGGGSTDGGDAGACHKTPICPGATIGVVRGDIGDDVREISGVGHRYFRVHVDEGSKESLMLRFEAEVKTFGGLYLGPKSRTIWSSTTAACSGGTPLVSGADGVSTVWGDTTNNEDARDFVVEIAPSGPNACEPWTLVVHR